MCLLSGDRPGQVIRTSGFLWVMLFLGVPVSFGRVKKTLLQTENLCLRVKYSILNIVEHLGRESLHATVRTRSTCVTALSIGRLSLSGKPGLYFALTV